MKTTIALLALCMIPFLAYSTEWKVEKDGITYASDNDSTCYTIEAKWDLIDAIIAAEIEGRKVTSIGNYTFASSQHLKSVSIPTSVLSIGTGVFYCCHSLVEITIPESVSSIEDEAFHHCTSLRSIDVNPANKYYCSEDGVLYNADKTYLLAYPNARPGAFQIPDEVLEIGRGAFYATEVESVSLPSSLQKIPEKCFDASINLKEIIFTEDCQIKEIGKYAFTSCSSLESISIPSSVLSIDTAAFYRCISLLKISIPENVSSIGPNAFSYCLRLQSIDVNPANKYYSSEDGVLYNADKTCLIAYPNARTGEYQIPEGVWEICPWAFYMSKIESVTFPSTLQIIHQSCFSSSIYLKEIIFPEDCHIKEIDTYAFSNCGLQQLVLPSSLERIGIQAFEYNTHLTKLWLPESVKLTEGREFQDCWEIEEVHIKTEEPYDSYAFPFTWHSITPKPRYLYVPKGCRERYEAYDCWTRFFYILDEGQDRSEAGIEDVEIDSPEDYYDLMGRKTGNSRGRIQISKGKKVIIL